ncbi:CAP domain-containing protein [Streptomyces sp. NPDC058417]|uniref:CAP domain-containing protein n=1 Tax=unclassified Streptomyces TaxID=2593676 RepID=UPI00365B4D32
MEELVPGGNVALPDGVLTVRVPGPFDVCALVTDDSGRVRGDADFVFYNQPTAPGAHLRGDSLTLDPGRLRAGATRVTVVAAASAPGARPGAWPVPALSVTDGRGRPLVRFAPPPTLREPVLLLAEVYRRGGAWKLRALGQGYADGLAGLARDFGVDVTEEPAAPPTAAPPPTAPPPRAHPAPARPTSLPSAPARPASARSAPDRAADPDGFLAPVNSARAAAGSAPVSFDPRLTAAARAHVAATAAAGRLGAEGADGVSLHQHVTAAGYRYLAVGEHLVSGPRTAAEFVDYCLRTDRAHRTLRDPAFTHVGLAHATDPRGRDVYWTAVWASPLTPSGLARTEAEVLHLTNRERARAGLRPLAVDARLGVAARAYSTDMAERAFYDHVSPEGTRPWDRAAAAGAAHRSIGENIACGQRSAAEVVEGWMNSPGHRANILKPDFTHLGVGYAGGGPAGTYWTQLFGG